MYPANTKLSSLKSRLRIIVFGALLTLLFTSCGAPFGAEQRHKRRRSLGHI